MSDTGLWRSDLPRKGWAIETIYELEKGLEEHCEWCGTAIRFVYALVHDEAPEGTYSAGCICAEKLTEDYEGVRKAESEYALKRKKLLREGWRKVARTAIRNDDLRIWVDDLGASWAYRFDNCLRKSGYKTSRAAKLAALQARGVL